MKGSLQQPKWIKLKEDALVHLRNPKKLRLIVLGGLALAGIAGVYLPLTSRAEQLERAVAIEKQRAGYIEDIDKLRSMTATYLKHLPDNGDANWWTEYFLTGIRDTGARLRKLEPRTERHAMGNFQGLTFKVEMEGRYEDFVHFISWLESNEKLVRVTALNMEKVSGVIKSTITIAMLTLKGKPNAH
jgi:hypothetical protein